MNQKILSCDLHDYIEIACMYNYKLRVSQLDDSMIEGVAKDTKTTSDKTEYMVLSVGDKDVDIELTQIKTIESLTENSKFQTVIF